MDDMKMFLIKWQDFTSDIKQISIYFAIDAKAAKRAFQEDVEHWDYENVTILWIAQKLDESEWEGS